MSSVPQRRPPATLGDSPIPDVRLRNWPLVDNGWRSVAVICLTAVVGLVSQWLSTLPMALLAACAVVVSMKRFWLPSYFRLHGRGIERVCLGRRQTTPWRSVRQCIVLRRGVLLLFHRHEIPMGKSPVQYIEWLDQRDDVLAAVDFFGRTSVIIAPSRRELSVPNGLRTRSVSDAGVR